MPQRLETQNNPMLPTKSMCSCNCISNCVARLVTFHMRGRGIASVAKRFWDAALLLHLNFQMGGHYTACVRPARREHSAPECLVTEALPRVKC